MPKERWIELSERVFPPEEFGARPHRAEARIGPAEANLFTEADLATFRQAAKADADEYVALLRHPLHRHLIKLLVFATRHVPDWLVRPLLEAAADTVDPSFNKHFTVPCTKLYGRRRVVTELIDIARTGPDPRKAGAANALYWGAMAREDLQWPDEQGYQPYEGPPDDPVEDLIQSFQDWAVQEFIDNPSLDVRRALVHHVASKRMRNTESGRAAIEIARSHPDEFIRNRLAADLGKSILLPCQPSVGER